jgi:hypothetical protein
LINISFSNDCRGSQALINLLRGSIICRKNKPNKLKKPLRTFYFFKLNLRIALKLVYTLVKDCKIADKYLLEMYPFALGCLINKNAISTAIFNCGVMC